MTNLIESSEAASEWLTQTKMELSNANIFGDVKESVIWVSKTDAAGNLIVKADPYKLRDKIRSSEHPIFLGHDAGFPIGRVIEAEVFTNASDQTFVVALLGFYAGRHQSFPETLMINLPHVKPPSELPTLPESTFIELAFDPRDVDPIWGEQMASGAPVQVRQVPLSLNALESTQDSIQVGLLFMTLVWNPFVTSIANEAGKDTYKKIREWLELLARKASDLRNPVLQIESYHKGCQLLFFIRGGNRNLNEAAAKDISEAANQAERIVNHYLENGGIRVLAFEYDRKSKAWRPSYAKNTEGALLTDDRKLIVVGNFPQELSLGFKMDDGTGD